LYSTAKLVVERSRWVNRFTSAVSELCPLFTQSRPNRGRLVTSVSGQQETFEITCSVSLLARFFASADTASARGGSTAPLLRRNLERRFVLYSERHRARDKAFLGGGIMQATRAVLIRAGRELGVRPQRDAFELTGAVRLLDLHAGGFALYDTITIPASAQRCRYQS